MHPGFLTTGWRQLWSISTIDSGECSANTAPWKSKNRSFIIYRLSTTIELKFPSTEALLYPDALSLCTQYWNSSECRNPESWCQKTIRRLSGSNTWHMTTCTLQLAALAWIHYKYCFLNSFVHCTSTSPTTVQVLSVLLRAHRYAEWVDRYSTSHDNFYIRILNILNI